MGFDITARSHLEYVEQHDRPLDEEAGCQEQGHWQVEEDEYPYHDDLKPGCYRETAATDSTSFHLTSAHFNWWHNQLSIFALGVASPVVWDEPDAFRGKPFFELIHFSDSYGTLGTAVCAKLARDFAEQEEAARKLAADGVPHARYLPNHPKIREFFPEAFEFGGKERIELYQRFKEAVLLGAQGGMVQFR